MFSMNTLVNLFSIKPKKEISVLVLGLDNAGKSTLIKAMNGETVKNLPPTKGFNFSKIEYHNSIFKLWDLGGQESIRTLWKNYLGNCDALIYVIDSTDTERNEESSQELFTFLEEEQITDVPLCIYANKQDLDFAMNVEEIIDHFKLDSITNRKWGIMATSAISKIGVFEGLLWIEKCFDT